MKITKTLLSLALAATVFSCSKDDKEATPAALTSAEMAEAVSQAFTIQGGGLVSQTEVAANIVMAANTSSSTGRLADMCGASFDTAFAGKNADTASIYTFNYGFKWSWSLSCKNEQPDQISLSYRGSNSYAGPRMTSEDSTVAKMQLIGLPKDSTFYTLSQTYTRTGSQQSLKGSKKAFKSTITIITSNMKLNKMTGLIVSGTATVKIAGTYNNGGDVFSKSGTFTFSGNGSGSLVLDGEKYTVAWVNE
jgi:hypothetical protein